MKGGDRMKMNAKMKSCMTPHVMMHGLFGLGLGIILVALFPALGMIWLGLVICVIAIVWDMMRKKA